MTGLPRTLLARADLLQLVTRLFGPPSEALRRDLDYSPAELRELLAASELKSELLEPALLETLELARETPLADWSAEHSRLFECGVMCPINETAYVRRDKGGILGDVAGFYAAFGVQVTPGWGEKVDHLSCELEFCATVCALWARALSEQSQEGARVCEGALRAFVKDHLGEWISGFCTRLAQTTGIQLFANASGLLDAVFSAFCRAHDLTPRNDKPLPVVQDAGTPYECGLADAGCP